MTKRKRTRVKGYTRRVKRGSKRRVRVHGHLRKA